MPGGNGQVLAHEGNVYFTASAACCDATMDATMVCQPGDNVACLKM